MTHKCSQIAAHGRPSGGGSTSPTGGVDVVVLGSGRGCLVTVDHPRPSQPLFGSGDVGHGGREILVTSSSVPFGPYMA